MDKKPISKSKKKLEEEALKKKKEKMLKNKRQLQSLIQQMGIRTAEAVKNVTGENSNE